MKTYIQSGNIIFDSAEKLQKAVLEQIANLLKAEYAFDVGVVMADAEILRQVVVDSFIYIKFAISASNIKLTNNFMQSRVKVTATTRDWNTTLKLIELLKA